MANEEKGRGGSIAPAWSEALAPEFLGAIIDRVAHPIFVKDTEFRFVLLNEAFCEMTGFSRAELLGKTDYDFFPKAEADFFRSKDIELFERKRPVDILEEPITDASGVKHVLATAKVPLFSTTGEVTHLVGIIHDITRLKLAEEALRNVNEDLERRVLDRTMMLEQTQRELIRRERLAALGQLAGGLAHQIRNPLGAIANAASILARRFGSTADPETAATVAIISEEVFKANRIITDLLDYARVRPASRQRVSPAQLVGDTLRALAIPPHTQISVDLEGAPDVKVDPDQVRGALENVIQNALDAMPGGGTLEIAAEPVGAGDRSVCLTFTDSGAGIDPSVRDQLFEPLMTTKPSGVGLGLSTARSLVENQGGTIVVRHAAPRTCFEVRLPLADGGRL